MTTIFTNISTFSRFNLSKDESDIKVFVKEYKNRINAQLAREEEGGPSPFVSYNETKITIPDEKWHTDNYERFLKNTANEQMVRENYLSELGYICSMAYSSDGQYIICGHSSGLIQMRHGKTGIVLATLRNIQYPHRPVYALEYSRKEEKVVYAACTDGAVYRVEIPNLDAAQSEKEMCIRADPALGCLHTQFYGTPGISSHSTPFITQRPAALSLGITADSTKIVVGYGDTSIKVYDMETQDFQVELNIEFNSASFCIRHLGQQRLTEVDLTFKVHKLRLQFIPKKLQRVHCGEVCAVRCHDQKPNVFASASWDKTLRIWDVRCKVGCVMTFEGVDIAHDSIDLNREQAVSGSWQTTEALSVWDLTAHKRLNVIRVQNRRPDVDGEYIYACRYWKSPQYNRKGKYAIIGGSGTKCVEVINLHNRYISCSYPAPGTILAVASHNERIAFGGTAPVFNIVSFHDPKHEKFPDYDESDFFDYAKTAVILFERAEASRGSETMITGDSSKMATRKSRVSMMGDGTRKSVVLDSRKSISAVDKKISEHRKSTTAVEGKKSSEGRKSVIQD